MESLTRLVEESMARHGFEPPMDHRRLHWSRWFRCETSFDLLLVPSKPGLFALGEEIVAPGEMPVAGGKRMLAVFDSAGRGSAHRDEPPVRSSESASGPDRRWTRVCPLHGD